MVLTLLCLVNISITYAESNKASGTPSHTQAATKPQQEPSFLSGKVVETMNSGGYTYLLLEKKGKKTWVAVPSIKATVGQEIALMPGSEMHNFTSKTLKRKFESIIFSAGPVNQPTKQQGIMNTETLKTYTGSSSTKVSRNEKIKVTKAAGPNAYTVSEIYKKRTALDSKNVVVRGKVVKVSANIMGKNWIHLQDGTGNLKDGSHELVVTSKDIPKVDEIVTASGTLYKDKDFGFGYKYTVIVEKAVVKK